MKYLKHFLKQMIFPIVYLFIMMMTSLAITAIDANLAWLKYLLFVLALALYAIVIGAMTFKDGEEAIKIRHMNDLERLQIIKTGEDRPLNLVKEYKPWKGFLSGVSASIPLIILMIIHTICILINPQTQWAGALASCLYLVFFAFFAPELTVASPYYYYFALVSLPILMLIMGVPYLAGAKRQSLQYKRVEEKHREIYGE